MTVTESKSLQKGTYVYWLRDAAYTGVIREISGDAVTIRWPDGHAERRTDVSADQFLRVQR